MDARREEVGQLAFQMTGYDSDRAQQVTDVEKRGTNTWLCAGEHCAEQHNQTPCVADGQVLTWRVSRSHR